MLRLPLRWSGHLATIFVLLLNVGSNEAQAVNGSPKLIARSGYLDGHNLPRGGFPLNATPVVGDHGLVAFQTLTSDDGDAAGLFIGSVNGETSRFLKINLGSSISRVRVIRDAVYFSVYRDLKFIGIYAVRPPEFEIEEILVNNPRFRLESVSDFYVRDDGYVIFQHRAGEVTELMGYDGGKVESFYQAVYTNQPGSTYLHSPDFNSRYVAAKILYKDADGRDRQTFKFWDTSLNSIHMVLPEELSHTTFGNSVRLSGKNDRFLVTEMTDENDCIYVMDLSGHTAVSIQNKFCGIEHGLELESFRPDVNAAGDVVFRAKDHTGKRGIYFLRDHELTLLVAEGDTLNTDIGPLAIHYGDNHPGFGGMPTLDDDGRVFFNATVGDRYEVYSKAIYMVDTRESNG